MKNGFASIIVFVIFGATLIGGTAIVSAAEDSKPGDALYPLKQTVEKARLALAVTPQLQEQARVRVAEARITEIKELFAEKGVNAPGLDIALANFAEQKQKIAELLIQEKAKGKTVSSRAKKLDNQFEQKEKELKQAFEEQKNSLKSQKQQLKLALVQALSEGNKDKVEEIRLKLAEVEKQLEVLEAQEDQAEEALEKAEEQMESQLEPQEQEKEEKERQLEKEKEGKERR